MCSRISLSMPEACGATATAPCRGFRAVINFSSGRWWPAGRLRGSRGGPSRSANQSFGHRQGPSRQLRVAFADRRKSGSSSGDIMRPSMPRDNFEKHDRLIRLMRELALFQAQPRGLTSAQIALKMEISHRQAQRDIVALESEYKVPFVKQGTRWTLIEGYFLPPVNFTVPEAMAMVVGARLMRRYADRANPFVQAAYEKLAAVLPGPMKEPVMEVADGLADKPEDGAWTKVFATLTTAWSERRKVRIRYTKEDGSTSERVVWPLV